MLDKLRERIYFLLIEKRDKVVAEATHFGVTVLEELLNKSLLANLFRVVSLLKALELTGCLGKGALASLFFEYQNDERALLVTLGLLATAMEKHGDLVYLEHHVGEEELVTVFWLDSLMVANMMIVLWLRLTTSLMQVDTITKRQVAAFYLTDRLVDECVEGGYVGIVYLPGRTSHEIVAEGQTMRFAQSGHCIIFRLEHLGDHDLRERVLVHAARTLMDEDIVVNLCEARDTVVEGDG